MSDTDSNYEAREQSEIKHYALRLYLEAATRIIGSNRPLIYVDCCAGPWHSCSPNCSDTSFGIAITALNEAAATLSQRGLSPQFSALLIEKKPASFAKLDAFAKTSSTSSFPVQARNWDFTEKLSDIVRHCGPSGAFSFIFIDPTGWQLAGISKIRPLLRLKPGEVLINLMSPFIARFIKDNKTDFSDLLGADFPSLRSLTGADLESAIVDKYCELIKREGNFAYVCSLPVMNPDLDSFNFHLIYATRHRKGVEVFKAVERRSESKTELVRSQVQQKDREVRTGKLDLFSANVLYRETCYKRLIALNEARAKAAVWKLLQSKVIVSYDDCWGEALQFSTVHEKHLRDWIAKWQQEGVIVVSGKAPNAKVLKVGVGISLALA